MSKEILIFGDIMLDCYIKGESNRLSPEAPVPVVNVNKEFYKLGGAANVAQNISNLNSTCSVCGLVGNDQEGKTVAELFQESNIGNYSFVPDEKFITTIKTRVVSSNQQIVRFDKEIILPDAIIFSQNKIKEMLTEDSQEIVIVSDYGKGACSEQMMETLFQHKGIKVLIDPKGNNWKKYNGAYLVKPNLKELSVIVGEEIKNTDEDIAHFGKIVLEKFNFQYLLVTRGANGMSLISKEQVSHHTVEKIRVYDVSGAGDTVISVLAVMLNNGHDIEYAVDIANEAGRFVVSQPDTYAINQEELENIISKK